MANGVLVSRDAARTTLAVVFIAGIVVMSLWVLRPFLMAAVWATMLVVTTWPLMLRVQSFAWGRRRLAVAVMIALLLLGLIVPLTLALIMVVVHAGDLAAWLTSLSTWSVPPPPDWLPRVPLIGARAAERWMAAAAAGPEDLSARLAPYTRQIVTAVVRTGGGIGTMVVQFLLVVVFAGLLYASGETVAAGARRFARRAMGVRGEHCLRIAAQAIRGVALGIIVTALVQACLTAVALVVAGVPFPGLLSALVFVLCIAQIGPAPVLLLAAVWAYRAGAGWWVAALLGWTIVVTSVDNVLRPFLIRRGANLPLLLVFVGVVGGFLAFGIVGLFVGPVVLAVSYTLLVDWLDTP